MGSGLIVKLEGAAPKWLLIVILTISFGLNGILGSTVVGLIIDRFALIERRQADPILKTIAELSEIQAGHTIRLKQHDDLLQRLLDDGRRDTKLLIELNVKLETLDSRLKRKGL